MRGDQSPPTQRLQSLTLPTRKTSATAALCKKLPSKTQKLPPCPATLKKQNKFSLRKWRDMGEVLGERGRFGGREPPSPKEGVLSLRGLSLRLPPTKRVRQPHPAQNPHLPDKQKTSPQNPATAKSETNYRSCNGGVLWGSSGWVREVWRVGRPLRKGSPCASKVFLSPHQYSFAQRRLRRTV